MKNPVRQWIKRRRNRKMATEMIRNPIMMGGFAAVMLLYYQRYAEERKAEQARYDRELAEIEANYDA